MIHILHPQTGGIVGYLDNNGENLFWNDLHEHHVNGFNTFRFTMNSQSPTSANVEGRSRVLIPSERNGYQEFIIHEVAVIDGDKEVFSTGAETELDKQKIIVPTTHKELTLKQYVELAVGGTEYQMGEVIFSGTRTITFEKHVGAYAFLSQVAKEFGVELSFRVEVSGNTIVGRYADLLSDDGIYSGKEIEYGKDLISIKKETFSDRIITSLLCLGPIKTDGTRLSVTVTDNDAFQRWGRDGKHIVGVYETTSDNVRMTIAQLTAEGKIELKKRIDSTDEFTVDAATIEGTFPNEKTFLGDKVRVKNLEYQPPLYAEARILYVKRALSDPSIKEFLVGNVLTYDVTKFTLPTPINDGCDPPANPKEGQLWINTCEEPPVMKKWSCKTGPTDCSNISPSQREFLDTYTGGDFTLVNTPGCIGMFGFKMVKEVLAVSYQWQINIYSPGSFPSRDDGQKVKNVTSEPYEEYGGLTILPVEIEKVDVIDGTSSGLGYTLRFYCNFTEGGVLQQAVPLFFATAAWMDHVKSLPDQFPSLLCGWTTVGSNPPANSTTAPVAPTNKDLWFDTSGTTPVLKQYDVTTTAWKTMVATKLSELTGELPGSRITDGTIPIAKLVPDSVITGIKKTAGTLLTGDIEFAEGTGVTIVQNDATKKLTFSSSRDATSIQGKAVPVPTVSEDEKVLAYDNDLGTMKWITPTSGGGALSATIGDGVATVFTIVHNLNTRDLLIELWDLTVGTIPQLTPNTTAQLIESVDVNTAKITFSVAPSANKYRAVMLSGGSVVGSAGVSSLKTTGGALITGDVEIVAGTGVTLSQDNVLKKITINSAGGDAISIKGIPVDATATTDGYVLTYDAVLAKFVLKPKPAGGGVFLQIIPMSQVTNLVINLTLTTYQNI